MHLNGVVVTEVGDSSNAAMTGFQKGDIILALNGQRVASTKDLSRLSGSGDHLYWRLTLERNGRTMETEVGG